MPFYIDFKSAKIRFFTRYTKRKNSFKKNKKIYNHLTGLYFFQKYVELTIVKVYIHVFYTNKMRLRHENPLVKIINGTLVDLPSPLNFSVWWNFGSLLGLVLIIQLATGIFLAIHYTADVELAFSSVRHIFRDVNSGWALRSMHANGASFFFICLYCHVGRGIYYGRYIFIKT